MHCIQYTIIRCKMEICVVLVIISFLCFSNGDEQVNKYDLLTGVDDYPDVTTTTFPPFLDDLNEEDDTNYTDIETATLADDINLSASTTEEPELLYLEFEYENMDRETFWTNNRFECVNGTLLPSEYLQTKYRQCERIHRNVNPQCTPNCEMAITMLLESRVPNLDLFKRFFDITLPEDLKQAAVDHYTDCFQKFGNRDDFLDYNCQRPQPFFECIHKFQLVCHEE